MDDDSLVTLFKALGNDNRLRIFQEIRDEGRSTYEDDDDDGGCFLNGVIERLGIGAPTVSHHLKQLVNAGLVQTEKRGKYVYCRLDGETLEAVSTFFREAKRAVAEDETAE